MLGRRRWPWRGGAVLIESAEGESVPLASREAAAEALLRRRESSVPYESHRLAEKAPSTMALLEHTLAIAQEDGVITGYEFELSDQLDGQRLVRVTIGVPTALTHFTVNVTKSDAEIPAAGPGMSEF